MKRNATIHRVVTPDHLCPWGIKAVDLLRRSGYAIEDHHLRSSDEGRAFKEQHHVDETPQIWVDGKRIGGYEDLRKFLGKELEEKEGKTYQLIIAIFSMTLLMALTGCWAELGTLSVIRSVELFIAFSMCVLIRGSDVDEEWEELRLKRESVKAMLMLDGAEVGQNVLFA